MELMVVTLPVDPVGIIIGAILLLVILVVLSLEMWGGAPGPGEDDDSERKPTVF